MGVMKKIFKKRQQLKSTNSEEFETFAKLESGEILQKVEESDDKIKIVLCTKKSLSEEQKNTIISIVKKGIESNAEPTSICVQAMMSTGIYDVMILNKIGDCIQVII